MEKYLHILDDYEALNIFRFRTSNHRLPVETGRWYNIDYQDRIMFGKDSYNKEEFYTYFRVLESDDEYFDYFMKRHAFWKMYGLNLPDDVLQKVYYKNALRLFPSIPKNLFE